MAEYKSVSDIKDLAKEKLTKKYSAVVLLTILSSSISMFINQTASSMVSQMSASLAKLLHLSAGNMVIGAFSYVLLFLASVLINIINVGVVLYYINIACNQPAGNYDLFYGYRQCFSKAFTLSLAETLLSTVCGLPSEITLYLFRKNYELNLHQMLTWAAFQFVGILVLIVASLYLSQITFLLLDYPELDAKAILIQSCRIMKGHKARLFFLEVSFLPLYILCLFTFGVGFLWLIPYKKTAYALFYLDLMNGRS